MQDIYFDMNLSFEFEYIPKSYISDTRYLNYGKYQVLLHSLPITKKEINICNIQLISACLSNKS